MSWIIKKVNRIPTHCGVAYESVCLLARGHVSWIIKKVNRVPTHCGVAYESVCLLARGHVIRAGRCQEFCQHL